MGGAVRRGGESAVREHQTTTNRLWTERRRTEVLRVLGNRCQVIDTEICAGAHPEVLHVDHAYGDGDQRRRNLPPRTRGRPRLREKSTAPSWLLAYYDLERHGEAYLRTHYSTLR